MLEVLAKLGMSPCGTTENSKLVGNLPNLLKNVRTLLADLLHYVYSQNQ